MENVGSRIHTTTFLKLYWICCSNEGSERIDSGCGYQVVSLKYHSLTLCLIIIMHKINRKKNVYKFFLTLVWICGKIKHVLPNWVILIAVFKPTVILADLGLLCFNHCCRFLLINKPLLQVLDLFEMSHSSTIWCS